MKLASKLNIYNYLLWIFVVLVLVLWLCWLESANTAITDEKFLIIVPGGGINHLNGTIPDHTEARLHKAIEIFTRHPLAAKIVTLSFGSTHKPPKFDREGFPVSESAMSAEFLIKNGVPASCIMEESVSLDTIGNAYFLRTIHTDVLKISRLIIITNKFHMARTRSIFGKIFSVSPPTPSYDLEFIEVDDIIDGKALISRQEREKNSLEHFNGLKFASLEQVHDFIFYEHMAYSSIRFRIDVRDKLSPDVLATY